jgi:hypothetical protein
MGSNAHMSQMEDALAAHGDEFREETWAEMPDAVKALNPKLELEAEVEDIMRWLVFSRPDGEPQYLELAPPTIFELERRYPDEVWF